nr:hypothetical protein [Tanacetum cinerariifolium]
MNDGKLRGLELVKTGRNRIITKIREKCMTLLLAEKRFLKDEHLDTILKTKSDEENESSVEDLNLTPSDFEDLSDIEISSPKFDSLLEEFFGELAHIDLISPQIDEAEFNPEKEIHLSFSPSPIPVEGNDSLMEEIDIFLALDDSIPSGIKNDNYDSEGHILEELLNNDSISLLINESFHFDHYYDPSSPRPPAKPPDDDGIYFDAEPDTRILTIKVADDISERYVLKISLDDEDSRARGFVLIHSSFNP